MIDVLKEPLKAPDYFLLALSKFINNYKKNHQ
jgi:hypothetical protein